MAKFFVSNNKKWLQDNILDTAKYFQRYNQDSYNKIFSVVYEKECYSEGNRYYDSASGEYCYAVGTYIYKNLIGADAVKKIYNDFDGENISSFKKDITGIYAVLICKKNHTYLFNDYYGLYDICYTEKEGHCTIGNSLKDVVSVTSDYELDEYPLLMQLFQLVCFPGQTMFKHVHKLLGNEYIELNAAKIIVNKIPNEEYRITYNYVGEDQALHDISSMLKHYAELIDSLFKSETICLTGGLDSRMVFGSFTSVNANIDCLYWTGRSMQIGDRKLMEDICNNYKVKYSIVDGSNPEEKESVDWIWQKYVFDKIGFSNITTSANKNQYDSIKQYGKRGAFLAFGYFCEAIRLRDWAAKLKKNAFSLKNYIDDYYINNSSFGVDLNR